MDTALTAIQLLPDYTAFAAAVVLAHWIWLFGLKKKGRGEGVGRYPELPDQAVPSLPDENGDIAASTQDPTHAMAASYEIAKDEGEPDRSADTHSDDYPIERPGRNSFPGKEAFQHPGVPPVGGVSPNSRDEIWERVGAKYVGRDILPTLERLRSGDLSPALMEELTLLSALTLSTEEAYPYAIDFA